MMIGTRNGYWLVGRTAPTPRREKIMADRDTTNFPGPNSDRVNVQGDELTQDQLDALTPEQRTRLTSGEPLPVDPRSPLADDSVRLVDEPEARSPVAQALDRVEGMGDGDGDGLMDHGTAGGEDRRETDTGATTDEAIDARDEAASDTPLADGLTEPEPWVDETDAEREAREQRESDALHG